MILPCLFLPDLKYFKTLNSSTPDYSLPVEVDLPKFFHPVEDDRPLPSFMTRNIYRDLILARGTTEPVEDPGNGQ